jgi:hypothetical protein
MFNIGINSHKRYLNKMHKYNLKPPTMKRFVAFDKGKGVNGHTNKRV